MSDPTRLRQMLVQLLNELDAAEDQVSVIDVGRRGKTGIDDGFMASPLSHCRGCGVFRESAEPHADVCQFRHTDAYISVVKP